MYYVKRVWLCPCVQATCRYTQVYVNAHCSVATVTAASGAARLLFVTVRVFLLSFLRPSQMSQMCFAACPVSAPMPSVRLVTLKTALHCADGFGGQMLMCSRIFSTIPVYTRMYVVKCPLQYVREWFDCLSVFMMFSLCCM